jgi:hypothetical protein
LYNIYPVKEINMFNTIFPRQVKGEVESKRNELATSLVGIVLVVASEVGRTPAVDGLPTYWVVETTMAKVMRKRAV